MILKHRLLLAEDDLPLAEEIIEELTSIGYEVVHVTSLEEALAAIERERFCFAILDLELPSRPGAMKKILYAGLTILKAIRQRHPVASLTEPHDYPVFIISGRLIESTDAVQATKLGATTYLNKPFDYRKLVEAIWTALREVGRESHESCHVASLTLGSPGLVLGPTPPVSSPAATVKLAFTPHTQRRRYEIVLNGLETPLQPELFVGLLRLAGARSTGEEKVSVHDLGATNVKRLRSALKKFLDGLDVLESDGAKGYRLKDIVHLEPMDWAALGRHVDDRIKKVAAEVLARIAKHDAAGAEA
jgi:DNA-binding response OmpR family regulator